MADATDPYAVTADELRQFIERFEQLESEKKDVSEQQKELMAEAKGRGYDTKVMRKVIQSEPESVAQSSTSVCPISFAREFRPRLRARLILM